LKRGWSQARKIPSVVGVAFARKIIVIIISIVILKLSVIPKTTACEYLPQQALVHTVIPGFICPNPCVTRINKRRVTA